LHQIKNKNMPQNIPHTPLMRQYLEMKAKHPGAILLYRIGDFYETFSEDAIKVSELLGITLTRKTAGAHQYTELAGFPHHSLDTYLPKLIRLGQRVAICEQLEDPKSTTKLVKRGITELVTPGVSIHDHVLDHKENNFLASVHIDKQACGLAFLDISTGEFLTTEGPPNYIDKLLNSFAPKEVLLERKQRKAFEEAFGSKWLTYEMEDWAFTPDSARDRLLKQFQTQTLKGFGIEHLTNAIIAAGAAMHYLDLTHHTQTSHISTLMRIEEDHYVRLDRYTVRSLELLAPMNEGGKSLLNVIDHTTTPMGNRMMRRWILFPLKEVKPIEDRLSIVEHFFRFPEIKETLQQHLPLICDLERIMSKVSVERANPREIVQLKVALAAIAPIKEACEEADNPSLKRIGEQLNNCSSIRARIEKTLSLDPPAQLNKGGVIAKGANPELDDLRDLAYSNKDYLLRLQDRESKRTGIPSLRISYNNVFGYYFEVRNVHKDKVPPDWVRKQTISQAERYVSQELKIYEEKILTAQESMATLEARLFADLVLELMEYIPPIQANANLIAQLDCLLSHTLAAQKNNYIRPQINDGNVIDITNGRHPVIELQLPIGEPYVPNNVFLDDQNQQIIIITGPNMAGKSALLRQTALITLMAQIGSFVPAEAAQIGLVDKIFTRVGASDNISQGESTFMVEMHEAADILNNLSEKSLILFDELGRGTSTYDGISIAWAIVEYIHQHPRGRAKTLFATHYHELNEMAKSFNRIKNYNVSVKEENNKILFLRKLEKGGSPHSYGIQVAKMAGMPPPVIQRSNEILSQMESDHRQTSTQPARQPQTRHEGYQMSFFQLDDPVLQAIRDELASLDLNNLTPLDALNKLSALKHILREK
jgi:DNA mismatch repair protein MutS